MSDSLSEATAGRRRSRSRDGAERPSERHVDYRQLRNPFPPVPVFSSDRVETIHQAALEVLETLGMKVLLPEARQIYARAGARVGESDQMVRIGREVVAEALATAPKSIHCVAGARHRDLVLELGALAIQTGAGSPHATDLVHGRRPSSLSDYEDVVRLTQHFDVLHMLNPAVEAQDVPTHLRHLAVNRVQLMRSDKLPFLYARGTPQVEDGFEMIRIARGIERPAFEARVHCYTIINTNSPRQLDIPMAQGLIDFARAGQMSVVTPFCLMGAMAPVSIAGALTLSHAEALAAITLTQLARPGAPVCYGAFASNVDLRSGAPAFGTPEQVKANLGAGQLARRLGLPWRCAAGSAANVNDAQAANETQMSAWGALLAGATVLIHGAGWIEGGLTVSYEKLITDLEVMQTFAELCQPTPADDAELALDALQEVAPGGHFFAAQHTMARYRTAFYEPLVADWSNYGTWTERGAKDANRRACEVWQRLLAATPETLIDSARTEALDAFVGRRTEAGGAPPVS
ncbi:MAG: trimethylamine methyltransferase family protein [Hyphomicrobiaceae bacterium]